MRTLSFIFFFLLVPVASVGEGVEKPKVFLHDGLERLYYLFEPTDMKVGAPILFALHGMGGLRVKCAMV